MNYRDSFVFVSFKGMEKVHMYTFGALFFRIQLDIFFDFVIQKRSLFGRWETLHIKRFKIGELPLHEQYCPSLAH